MEKEYDLAVIGGGSGGVRMARTAADFGAKVALFEAKDLGGTCVNVGCIPKKFMVYASGFPHLSRIAEDYGWTATCAHFDWHSFVTKRDLEIARLRKIYDSLLGKVDVYRDFARFAAPDSAGLHKLTAGDATVKAKRVVVATGGIPNTFAQDNLQSPALVNSDDVFALATAPKRAVIVGGGYIAVEFAGIFNGLGIPTTLIYRGDEVLNGFDDDLRAVISKAIAASGVDLRLNTTITGIETCSETEVRCALSDGTTLDTDMLFHAIGRTPNLAGLGLEQVGLAPSKHGTLTVDANFETAVAGIYALGDVVGRYALTPIATGEATILARRLYGGFADTQTGARAIDYTLVPSAVFSQPEVATCGLTEHAALARGNTVDVYTTTFTPMLTSLSGIGDVHESAEALRESERIFMKLVVDHTSQVVLGCHMVGHGAADIIQGLAVALQAGVTKQQVDATIGIHPTSAEEFVTMRTATRTQIAPAK